MRLVSPICCFFFALFALSHECQCKLSKLTIFADSFDALHVYAGQTATLSYTRKVRESRVDFRGWRVKKNGEVFGGLKKEPGSVYQCTDALLWQFCLTKTEFLKLEESLLLRIRNTSVNDSGNYTVEWVFNSLESNDKEEMQLDVSKGMEISVHVLRYKHSKNSYPVIHFVLNLSAPVYSAQSMIWLIQYNEKISGWSVL